VGVVSDSQAQVFMAMSRDWSNAHKTVITPLNSFKCHRVSLFPPEKPSTYFAFLSDWLAGWLAGLAG